MKKYIDQAHGGDNKGKAVMILHVILDCSVEGILR